MHLPQLFLKSIAPQIIFHAERERDIKDFVYFQLNEFQLNFKPAASIATPNYFFSTAVSKPTGIAAASTYLTNLLTSKDVPKTHTPSSPKPLENEKPPEGKPKGKL